MPRIAVLCRDDHDRPPGLDALSGRAEIVFTDAAGLGDVLPDCEGLFLWELSPAALRTAWPQAQRLRWIHIASDGVDSVLFDELIASDVVMTNARGVFDQPIAEFVLAVVLAQLKGLFDSRDAQRDRRWAHHATTAAAGQRALIVGTGGIGRASARLLRAVGLSVRGAGRVPRETDPDFSTVVDSAHLERYVGDVDHLVVALPLTPQTNGLIGARVFDAMKPGTHLVNVGRGPTVDEPALLAALTDGRLAAASLDVFSTEPLPDDHRFWTMPNVVVSPHLSGDTHGFRARLAEQFVETAERWLDGRPVPNTVDKQRGYSATQIGGLRDIPQRPRRPD